MYRATASDVSSRTCGSRARASSSVKTLRSWPGALHAVLLRRAAGGADEPLDGLRVLAVGRRGVRFQRRRAPPPCGRILQQEQPALAAMGPVGRVERLGALQGGQRFLPSVAPLARSAAGSGARARGSRASSRGAAYPARRSTGEPKIGGEPAREAPGLVQRSARRRGRDTIPSGRSGPPTTKCPGSPTPVSRRPASRPTSMATIDSVIGMPAPALKHADDRGVRRLVVGVLVALEPLLLEQHLAQGRHPGNPLAGLLTHSFGEARNRAARAVDVVVAGIHQLRHEQRALEEVRLARGAQLTEAGHQAGHVFHAQGSRRAIATPSRRGTMVVLNSWSAKSRALNWRIPSVAASWFFGSTTLPDQRTLSASRKPPLAHAGRRGLERPRIAFLVDVDEDDVVVAGRGLESARPRRSTRIVTRSSRPIRSR